MILRLLLTGTFILAFHLDAEECLEASPEKSSCYNHFSLDDNPCKVRESMPMGACWDYNCDCGDEYATETIVEDPDCVCIENCIYECLNPCCLRGVWLPEAPPLFLPFKADPRQLEASVGLRFGDKVFGSPLVDVSYFDIIPIYRFFNLFTEGDQLELDVEGALWAIFKTFAETAPLVNADYYIGGSINYAWNCWSFRFRFFHISSHIGDEFLILHPDFDRRNPSAEYMDIFASYQPIEPFRIYGGVGYIPIRDPSYRVLRWYFQGGAEYYFPFWDFTNVCHLLQGRPYAAVNIGIWQNNSWNPDQTYVLGYEIAKLYGLERKLRLYLQYHNGYSLEGQFCHLRTQYFSVRLSYGF